MRFLFLSFLLLLPFFSSVIDACTTLAVGSKASADGSVFAAHSDDGLTDPRLVYIPPKDYSAGSKRPVYYSPENYPRYIGNDRSPTYAPQSGQTPFVPIGYIDQVSHTYGYWEGTYGIMNEKHVGIAESTCSGIYSTSSIGQGGKALFSIDELSHIALERCDSARCAVKTIGKLSEEYGFYGADGGTEGGSESLLIHDTKEAFIFHILPDPTGTSSIWAAQRVPDDGYAVVANMFTIRNIDKSDSENFLFSDSVYSVAIANGLWSPDSGVPLDFTGIYSDGEYGHKYYSGRRMWIVYQLFSSSLNISDQYDNLKHQQVYPTTARPDKPIALTDIFSVYRNYYQNTKYDMTVGLAAGPWGDPDRFGTWSSLPGSWERSIGIYRTAYTHVTQARSNAVGVQKGIIWFSSHVSSSSPFIPLSSSLQQMPASFAIGNPSLIQRTSAYWASRYLFNIAKSRYNVIMKDIVALRTEIELKSIVLVAEIDAGLSTGSLSFSNITALYNNNANSIVSQWWALSDYTIGKNADGYTSQYPDWWLKAVGYENGPGPAANNNNNNANDDENKKDITNNGQYDFKPAAFNLIKKEMQ